MSAAFFLSGLQLTNAQQQVSPAFSTAGFYTMPETGREVFSMNPVWRFFRGDAADAYRPDYADTSWQVVHLPHGIEVLPEEGAGESIIRVLYGTASILRCPKDLRQRNCSCTLKPSWANP
ncbi:MAG: hypothetical protein M9926_09100 [Lentimicrobium sp.]|uniref:hypothetical protein n=1 Tax=Lentimicrobium sp. TaxID=2034841 RepID=UPI0025D0EDEE|nr:hypothetical protein [Lentimicrobium sp.]MCO5256903.1 hypothetical protein [Lentimicrobium sp.]